jgi:hypothetical protein
MVRQEAGKQGKDRLSPFVGTKRRKAPLTKSNHSP